LFAYRGDGILPVPSFHPALDDGAVFYPTPLDKTLPNKTLLVTHERATLDQPDRMAPLDDLQPQLKTQIFYTLRSLAVYKSVSIPSLAIYRAGDYMLAAPFLHGSLAVNTFQLELKLNTSNQLIMHTLEKDFELMWQVARRFYPDPNRNWRNDLKILFTS
jgi:hypothetical protein